MQGCSGKASFFKWCQKPAAEKSGSSKKGNARTATSNTNTTEAESDDACTLLVGIPGVKARLEKMNGDGSLAKLIPANLLKTLLPVSSPAMISFLQKPSPLALRVRSHVLEPFEAQGNNTKTHLYASVPSSFVKVSPYYLFPLLWLQHWTPPRS